MFIVCFLIALVALAAVGAWVKVFLPISHCRVTETGIAGALLLVILLEPFVAILLALGARSQN